MIDLMYKVRRLRRELAYRINQRLPFRPDSERGANVSWKARLWGEAKCVHIGRGARIYRDVIFNCLTRDSDISVGSGTVILSFAKLGVGPGGKISVGKNCSVHSFCVLYGDTVGLRIEDNVRISVHAIIIDGNHNYTDASKGPNEQGSHSHGVHIGEGCWIGAGATILDGARIPARSVVAAGAVVTKAFSERGLYAGVPAKLVKPI